MDAKRVDPDAAKRLALVRLALMRRAIDDRRQNRDVDAGTTADPLRDFWHRDR